MDREFRGQCDLCDFSKGSETRYQKGLKLSIKKGSEIKNQKGPETKKLGLKTNHTKNIGVQDKLKGYATTPQNEGVYN